MKKACTRRAASASGAFTLIELLVVIAIIALLIGILLPALGEARKTARKVISGSNLRQQATAMNSYATDFKDRIPAFTWQGAPGKPSSYSQWSDLNGKTNDLDAAANQAVDIIRRRAGRDNFPQILGWIPHIYYSHLVVMDYFASRLPERIVACPEDRNRQQWQKDPENNFDKDLWAPLQEQPIASNLRWPYSSSYRPTITSFDRTTEPGNRISQAGVHNAYFVPGGCNLGDAKLASVDSPSSKAYYFEGHEWHGDKRFPFHATPLAKYHIATFDGAVAAYSNASQVNKGWNPTNPKGTGAMVYSYSPNAQRPWEPRPLNEAAGSDSCQGYVQYTRGGLAGIDVGGTEVNTGQLK